LLDNDIKINEETNTKESEDLLKSSHTITHEHETIKSSLTVKNDLRDTYTTVLLEISIKILNTIELLKKEGESSDRTINQLLTVLTSEYGPEVIKHLNEHHAYTYGIIERKLGVSKATIHYITNKLRFLKFIIEVKIKKPNYIKNKGPAPSIWLLRGAKPERAAQCLTDHYKHLNSDVHYVQDVLKTKRENKAIKDKNIQDQLIEDFSSQVITKLGNWDMAKLHPLYTTMAGLQIPVSIKSRVSDRVIDYFKRRNPL